MVLLRRAAGENMAAPEFFKWNMRRQKDIIAPENIEAKESMMSRLIFDFNNMIADRTGGKGFTPDELEKAANMAAAAYCAVSGRHLGFRSLPRGQDDVLDDILATAQDIRESFDNFVVLGIGGSALGPIAVHQALGSDTPVRLFVEDNIDPVRLSRVLGGLDLKRTIFNVITKSGKTSETMAQLMYVAGALKEAGLPLSSHVIDDGREKRRPSPHCRCGEVQVVCHPCGCGRAVFRADAGGPAARGGMRHRHPRDASGRGVYGRGVHARAK